MTEASSFTTVFPLNEGACVVDFGPPLSLQKHQLILALSEQLEERPCPGYLESVPAYVTLTVFFDPAEVSHETVIDDLRGRLSSLTPFTAPCSRIMHIPVCYEGACAPDLADAAERCGLTTADIVGLHTSTTLFVFLIGFAPGLPYLGTLPALLGLPRKMTPRASVPAGSVGLMGGQSVIYPYDSPAGWHIIGQTPTPLFNPDHTPPALLRAGDRVQFTPISLAEYRERL